MRLDEPSWWYAERVRPAARLLAPAGALWGHLAQRRFRATTPYRSRLPVICVGNFTAGGTGKTPLTLLLVEELRKLGRSPAVLTRGYGGAVRDCHWVDLPRDTARDVGDEPLLLAAAAPTLVARDRAAGARAIEQAASRPGVIMPDVIVMDDGLQNPALRKDLSLAVVDGRRGLGNGRVMPAGPLRAPLAFQLALADAIVVNAPSDRAIPAETVMGWLRQPFKGPVLAAQPRPAGDARWLVGTKVAAYAAIGSPDRFFDLLRQLGAEVVAERRFPDHHAFSDRDAMGLLQLAAKASALLITTEKDLARLRGRTGAAETLRLASLTLPIRLHLDAPHADQLVALLTAALERAHPSNARY